MNKIKITNNLKCEVCNTIHKTPKSRNKCIVSHNITIQDYIVRYYFNNEPILCGCGCGELVKNIKWIKDEIQYSSYIRNHFPRNLHTDETKEKIKVNTLKSIQEKYGVDNVFQSETVKKKIQKTNLEKYGVDNPMKNKSISEKASHPQTTETIKKIKQTNLEKYGANSFTATDKGKLRIKQTMLSKYGVTNPMHISDVVDKVKDTNLEKYGYSTNFLNPDYRKTYNKKQSKYETLVAQSVGGEVSFILNGYEYDVRVGNYLIEIDGDYHHPDSLTNLSFTQMNSILNDKIKDDIASDSQYTLIRIKVSTLKKMKNITLGNIIQHSYSNNFKLNYNDIILSSNYLKSYLDKYGYGKLQTYIPMVLKFIRTFSPQFPNITTDETTDTIKQYIHTFDTSLMVNNTGNFINKNFNVGVSWLKSNFNSFWNSSNKGSKSPMEVWNDDMVLYNLISYRMGLNLPRDAYNISLRGILYAMSVNRYTVSFFKPSLASSIYSSYLKSNINPMVLDPCAGFGGRLIGFKSKYPNGIYVGIEPNIDTYNSLIKLVDDFEFTNVKLYNCKIEDFVSNDKYDLTFTSIPYYDLENYNNSFEYSGIEEWKSTFIQSILRFDNVVLNVNESIYNQISTQFDIVSKIVNSKSPFNGGGSKCEFLIKPKTN